ncbi:MAG: aminoglycoside phosphotransferase family protein [Anaerolineaceae bacterium]
MTLSSIDLEALREIAGQFCIAGDFVQADAILTGHINDTYRSAFRTPQGTRRYIHQRINHHVFKQPEQVMENIQRVTAHARQRVLAEGGDAARRVLALVNTRAGQCYHKTAGGEYWRTYHDIEGARSYEIITEPRQVYNAAFAFGQFASLLEALPGPPLHEVIANFHHTPLRCAAFQQAVQADHAGRAHSVQAEIDFAQARQAEAAVVTELLASGSLPTRVTHNDTKLNNVLIDDHSGEGICVIDLDTVMPGSLLYDFGDLVRMGATTAAEDETDLDQVSLDLERFDWLAHGYLDGACQLLVPAEKDLLAFAARLITFEQGIRFLSDYLNGDVYYKTQRPRQNLDRARVQFKLLREMEQQQGKMEAIIRSAN